MTTLSYLSVSQANREIRKTERLEMVVEEYKVERLEDEELLDQLVFVVLRKCLCISQNYILKKSQERIIVTVWPVTKERCQRSFWENVTVTIRGECQGQKNYYHGKMSL